MEDVQMEFIMALIEDNNVENILEIGVYNGVNSIAMMKSGLEKNKNFQLYSIDLGTDENIYGKAAIDTFSNYEREHYHLYLGKTVFNLEEIIPNKIKFDLIFIDAGHSYPLALVDLIYSIPYLNTDGIILLHDIIDYDDFAWGESYIFEAWSSEKYRIYDYYKGCFSNMGCILLHKDKELLYDNIKFISKMPFMANPWIINKYNNNKIEQYTIEHIESFGIGMELKDLNNMELFMNKYYDTFFVRDIINIFKSNFEDYKNNALERIHMSRFFHTIHNDRINIYNRLINLETHFENYIHITKSQESNNLEYKFNKLIDQIAWWIPLKKWRDNFRNKILNS